MIIYINGRGMNAPELKAYISKLEAALKRYESENVELKELLQRLTDIASNLCFAVGETTGCEFCPYGKTNPEGACTVEILQKTIEEAVKNE